MTEACAARPAAPPQPAPDPRPRVTVGDDGQPRLHGGRCEACGHAIVCRTRRCPRCAGPVAAHAFGPEGRVWSSTTVHVATAGRPDPYTLAYVDLDDGPRLLAHVRGAGEPAPVGAGARLTEPNADGDPQVELTGR